VSPPPPPTHTHTQAGFTPSQLSMLMGTPADPVLTDGLFEALPPRVQLIVRPYMTSR
jgi:hypothetical protein